MTTININKIYTFTIEQCSWGDLTRDDLNLLFRDGRACAPLIQLQLTKWFDCLDYVNGSGFDHMHKVDQTYFEHKCFTKGGCNFAPSFMVGSGRKIHDPVHASPADRKIYDELIYIITDITEFPTIKVRFVAGKELRNLYPKQKIPRSAYREFFKLTPEKSAVTSII
jgi:hypothetical protein